MLLDEVRARDFVRGAKGVGEPVLISTTPQSVTLEMDYAGDDRAAAMLLSEWVTRGAPIAEFSEGGNALEDLFLQLTAAENA
jgi:hypothetical protein